MKLLLKKIFIINLFYTVYKYNYKILLYFYMILYNIQFINFIIDYLNSSISISPD